MFFVFEYDIIFLILLKIKMERKMFKIGIVGVENSHAKEFTKIFNTTNDYPDIKVVGVGGMYPESNKALAEEFGLKVYDNYLDMIGEIDAVMITARDGKFHAEFAKPFIQAKLPIFIDKPITIDGEEAADLLRRAKNNGVPVVGGSSLKYVYDILTLENLVNKNRGELVSATLTSPLNMNNEYSGFYFYSSHLVEMCLKVFGFNPIEVTAKRNNDSVMCIVKYENFNVCLQYLSGCWKYFGQIAYGNNIAYREIDLSLGYKHECNAFADMLRDGSMPFTYEELVKAVYFLNAIEESYTTEKTVRIQGAVI